MSTQTNYTLYSVADLLKGKAEVDSAVMIRGWVKTRRDSNAGLSFLTINDGSCFTSLQIIAPKDLVNYQTEVLRITTGCAVSVTGKLVQSPAKGQSYEVQANLIQVVGWVDNPETYPISPKNHSLEYLREHAHLRPRTNVIGSVTRMRHYAAWAIHKFFHERGFYWVHTPIITTNDCEGAGELLRVTTLDMMNLPHNQDGSINYTEDFFGKETFLTVSGQLDVESYCMALSKVYTFGPTFRAEKSFTSRHLAEFWMLEPEIAFADLQDLIKLAEDFLKTICKDVLNSCQEDLKFFVERIDKNCIRRLEELVASEFAIIEYGEAINILQRAKKDFIFPVKWGTDLQSEHERYLVDEYIGRPVAVINYPKEIKSFYMRLNEDEKTVAAMDILAPGIGEIIGGSQREERFQMLHQRMQELQMNTDLYWWYRDLRRYGSVPHSGFGLGFERFLMYLTGMTNIRDMIPFPRSTKNADF